MEQTNGLTVELCAPETFKVTRRDGAEITVNPANWPIVSLQHALENGISQLLRDAAAGQKEPDKAKALMAKKAHALANGDIRQRKVGTASGALTALVKMALALQRPDLKGDSLQAVVDKQLTRNRPFWEAALANQKAMAAGLEIKPEDDSDE